MRDSALTRRFAGTAALPRVRLCDLPTPLAGGFSLPVTSPVVGGSAPAGLSVKCDDVTSAAYGGNKVRKLEFLLGKALAEERRAVVTFGAYGSNHALATAVHANAVGLEPHVVLSPQAPTPFARATLLAHAGLGSAIHLTEGWDGSETAARVVAELAARNGIEPLVIPLGGTSGLGALGYVDAALEVVEQTGEAGAPPDDVYVPGGTLGTAVGIAIGLAAAGWATRVVAVRVTPGEVANEAFASALADETVALLRSLDDGFPALAFGDLALALRHDHFEPGYGVVTPETTEAVRLAGEMGLKLETTYTGKAFSALLADASAGRLAGKSVLFWNTYSAAVPPAPGSREDLPEPLRSYIDECDRLFGSGSS